MSDKTAYSPAEFNLCRKGVATMEFGEKLQALRKQKDLTQEELSEILFVSRTAVLKWESGRGYPNIDSLKAIAKFFGISIDELLSGDELLTIAEKDVKQKEYHLRDLVFGLLDVSVAVFFFLPLFGQQSGEIVDAVSILSLSAVSPILKSSYFVVVILSIVMGILTLVLQNCRHNLWLQFKSKSSLMLSAVGSLLFIISQQPYAATFMFIYFIIKVILITKRQ